MTSLQHRFPLGKTDFRDLRESGDVYIDKSMWIHDVLDQGASILLFPRPRRFGKTLNLSMLRYFLEKSNEDRRHLFQGLAIEKSEVARTHFQKHPVIFISLKDAKQDNWEACQSKMKSLLADLYKEHRYLLESESLYQEEKKRYRQILEQQAPLSACVDALYHLSKYLCEYHKQPVVLLIDEYDSPLHHAYSKEFYEPALSFFRTFLSTALKDNAYVYKGVMTGILRIAKESIFSGLNNIVVYTLTSPYFSKYFGFTEDEVRGLVQQCGHPDKMEEIRTWYNGYVFGKTTIVQSLVCAQLFKQNGRGIEVLLGADQQQRFD